LKLIDRTTTLFLATSTLFSASMAWAAEPSQAAAAVANPQVASPDSAAPAVASAQPSADQTGTGQLAPAAAPTPALAAAPNSVEVSPYGAGASDAPPPTATPAPPPRRDVPATLFDSSSDYSIGGFGGIGVMYTRFAGGDRPLICGEGAVIIDHQFTLGGGGCGIASRMSAEKYGAAPHSTDDRLLFGYGGAIVRYHFFSRRAVNLAVGGLIGAGGLQLGTWNGKGSQSDTDNFTRKSQDAVFVVEPQVGGYVNLTRWLRFGAVGGFRFVSGVDTKGLRSQDLMGPTLGGQIQGGWF
jgi:hypothetical protein